MYIPNPLLALYGLVWKLARPFLRRHKRLSKGFESRLVPSNWPFIAELQRPQLAKLNPEAMLDFGEGGAFKHDFWIQSASGGESYLSYELLKELASRGEKFSVLCTSCTEQGLAVLHKAQEDFYSKDLKITVGYFPLDEPPLMHRALRQVFNLTRNNDNANGQLRNPRLILLETEIWPGLLNAAKRSSVEVMILNGRMTSKSLTSYNYITPFLRKNSPDLILATSPEDLERMASIFYGPSGKDSLSEPSVKSLEKRSRHCGLMHNIKFDRIQMEIFADPDQDEKNEENHSNIAIYSSSSDLPDSTEAEGAKGRLLANPLEKFLTPECRVVVFASVRKEEEALLLPVVSKLEHKPGLCVVVAPRHMHRIDAWTDLLTSSGLAVEKRSEFKSFTSGGIVLWDSFGEMLQLYSIASAVFVGGSMAPLGGQNFLEPLSCGIEPCIGPYWSNFYWTGTGLFERKLVHRVETPAKLGVKMLDLLKSPRSRDEVKADFYSYVEKYKGGTKKAVEAMLSPSPIELIPGKLDV